MSNPAAPGLTRCDMSEGKATVKNRNRTGTLLKNGMVGSFHEVLPLTAEKSRVSGAVNFV